MRVGWHANTLNNADVLVDWAERLQPPAVVTLDFRDDVLARVKAVSPDTQIIGRVMADQQPLDNDGKRWVRTVLVPKAREHPLVDRWIGYNEVAVYSDHELRQYSDLERYRILRLAGVGAKAVVANSATGNFAVYQMGILHDMLQATDDYDAWIGTHQYSAPYMQWLCGQNQIGEIGNDLCLDPDVRGWTTLRHRYWWAGLDAMGYGHLPVVITEGGIDGGVNPRPGPQGGGWKDFTQAEWVDTFGDYADQWRWFMWQLSHDNGNSRPNVVGAVTFGEGTIDPTWESFRVDNSPGMLERLIQRQLELPVGHYGAAPSVPTPEPPVAPGPERAVFPAVDVLRGDGYYSIARDIWPDFSESEIGRIAGELSILNHGRALTPGDVIQVPRYTTVRLDWKDN